MVFVFFPQFALTHNCSQSLFIHRRQGNRKELKYAEFGHRCFPSAGDTQLGLMYVSDHLASGKHLLRCFVRLWICHFFSCPYKPFSNKETLLMPWGSHDFREHLLAWLKYQDNSRVKKGSKILGRMGCFSERLLWNQTVFNAISKCLENQAGNAWKVVSALQLSWRQSNCNGRHRSLWKVSI